jgi:hypothetical protein
VRAVVGAVCAEAPLALVLALVGVRGAWGSATEDTSVFATSTVQMQIQGRVENTVSLAIVRKGAVNKAMLKAEVQTWWKRLH